MTSNREPNTSSTLTMHRLIEFVHEFPYPEEPEECADSLNRIARAQLVCDDREGDTVATVAALTAAAHAAGLVRVGIYYDNNALPADVQQPSLELWMEGEWSFFTLRYPRRGLSTLIEHGAVGFVATSEGWHNAGTATCLWYRYTQEPATAV